MNLDYRFDELQFKLRVMFLVGTCCSCLGFTLPWFQFSDSSQWWYSGWQLMRYEGFPRIDIIYLLYAVLFIIGFTKLWTRMVTPIATIFITLVTLAIMSLCFADAVPGIRTMERLVWSIGLWIMFGGHALMIWGAFAGWSHQTFHRMLQN